MFVVCGSCWVDLLDGFVLSDLFGWCFLGVRSGWIILGGCFWLCHFGRAILGGFVLAFFCCVLWWVVFYCCFLVGVSVLGVCLFRAGDWPLFILVRKVGSLLCFLFCLWVTLVGYVGGLFKWVIWVGDLCGWWLGGGCGW